MPKARFDITEVLHKFLNHRYPERRELFEEFQSYIASSTPAQQFVRDVAEESLSRGGLPTLAMGSCFDLWYGNRRIA
jgi:5'-deoxynucleotidase YfbR-like HD superfamily hydrolase